MRDGNGGNGGNKGENAGNQCGNEGNVEMGVGIGGMWVGIRGTQEIEVGMWGSGWDERNEGNAERKCKKSGWK